MKTEIQRMYWKWEESKLRDPIHWIVFFAVGIFIVMKLVSSISATAAKNSTINSLDATATAALIN